MEEKKEMRRTKRVWVLLMAVMMVCGLVACGSEPKSETSSVNVYTMDGKFNSETVNMRRNLYLVDEDTYILELEVFNSQDLSQHTVEFIMRGVYEDHGDGTITLKPGYGNGYAMNGNQKLACTATEEEWNTMFEAMFGVNGATKFTLNENGTYIPAE